MIRLQLALGVILLAGCSNSSANPQCSMVISNSCVFEDKYCDATDQCQSCPAGFVNCDGDNNNACEVTGSSCEAGSCSDCKPPNCCDEGFCRGSDQFCSNGGVCEDGACTEVSKCADCTAPSCCDDGVCREPNDTCSNGGACNNGGCSAGPCDSCTAPRCCDELVCLSPGDRCADGSICTAGQCYDHCDLCPFPYCCDGGNCLMEGKRCTSGGTCLDASCGPANCTTIAQWVGSGPGAYDSAKNITIMNVPSPTDSTMMLRLELFHDQATLPQTINSEIQSLPDCEAAGICAKLGTGCGDEFSSCNKQFLALTATLEVTRADALPSGAMVATIKSARLVEWDMSRDRAAAGWQCFELGAAGLSASW